MATSPTDIIPDSSYDASAISTVVANRSASNPRQGLFFDTDFEAVVPVHFQNLDGNRFLGVFAERWYAATRPSGVSDSNLIASYTADTLPSWAIFNGSTGQHYAIPGHDGFNPPTRISHDTRKLIGACSRTNSFLYLMQSFTSSGSTFGVLSHFHINPVIWQVSLLGEEKISTVTANGQTVTFNQGIKYGTPYLVIVGTDSSGHIYFARKNWGYVGTIPTIEYQTEKGWSQDPSNLVPLKDIDGNYVTSAGPVSLADYKGRTWMAVIKNSGGTMSAQVYTSAGLYDPWKPENHPYSLGTLGSTYMGGTLYFQPALGAHPTSVAETSVSGIPAVYCTKTTGTNKKININWELWPITASGNSRSVSADSSLGVEVNSNAN
jgi:hypothetical protein